ncbi:MAG: hypothetical protein Q4F79_10410 [Eubacteriales bacterium]|nr:hypothetical protein [Eubacteriales bacterium]
MNFKINTGKEEKNTYILQKIHRIETVGTEWRGRGKRMEQQSDE